MSTNSAKPPSEPRQPGLEDEGLANEPTAIGPAPSEPARELIAGRYRVLRELGEGGMGTVYLAEHVLIEKKVAIKVLSRDLARNTDLVRRFMQEAKAASRIGHEHIVDVTDFGETSTGSVFFAMEYLDGISLADAIDEGPMPFARASAIMRQICSGLGAAHDKGIVHRDMKPENVFLISRHGRPDFVKVLDFGIAKISSGDEAGPRLTQAGMIFGTAEYMSPEQARGDTSDHRADVYACGCILYELLTGDVPFHADSFMGVLTKHLFEPPVPPRERAPGAGISAGVEAVVLRALAKKRDERYASMREFAQALLACDEQDEGATVVDAPISVDAPRGRRAPVLLGLAGAIVLVGGATAWWRLRPPSMPVVRAPASLPPSKPPVTVPPVVAKPEAPPKTEPAAPSTPEHAPAPVEHAIRVTSIPPGAEVFRGTSRLGLTPGPFHLEASPEIVTLTVVKKGYRDYSLSIRPDQDRQYKLRLSPLPRGHRPVPVHTNAPSPTITHPEAPRPAPKPDLMDPFEKGPT